MLVNVIIYVLCDYSFFMAEPELEFLKSLWGLGTEEE
jgi:hypothetical protein